METRKLYHGNDFIIVNAGSAKERDLLASGWKSGPRKAARQTGNPENGAPEGAIPEAPETDIPPAA